LRPHRTERCFRLKMRQPAPLSPRIHACQSRREIMGMYGACHVSLTPPCTTIDQSNLQKLVATPLGGFIHTSTNSGETWTARNGPDTYDWAACASSADGTMRQARIKQPKPLSVPRTHACLPCVCREAVGMCGIRRRLSLTFPCSTADLIQSILQKIFIGSSGENIWTSPLQFRCRVQR